MEFQSRPLRNGSLRFVSLIGSTSELWVFTHDSDTLTVVENKRRRSRLLHYGSYSITGKGQ